MELRTTPAAARKRPQTDVQQKPSRVAPQHPPNARLPNLEELEVLMPGGRARPTAQQRPTPRWKDGPDLSVAGQADPGERVRQNTLVRCSTRTTDCPMRTSANHRPRFGSCWSRTCERQPGGKPGQFAKSCVHEFRRDGGAVSQSHAASCTERLFWEGRDAKHFRTHPRRQPNSPRRSRNPGMISPWFDRVPNQGDCLPNTAAWLAKKRASINKLGLL